MAWNPPTADDGTRLDPPVGDDDHTQGPAVAPVTLVVYGDYVFPYTGRAHRSVLAIQNRLGDRLRFVFRNFPLTAIHPHAQHAAEVAEAADAQGRFWAMHDHLFAHQQALSDDDFRGYGAVLELDAAGVERELTDHVHLPRLETDNRSDERSGVEGTPALVFDGLRHQADYEIETLLAALDPGAPRSGWSMPTERRSGHATTRPRPAFDAHSSPAGFAPATRSR